MRPRRDGKKQTVVLKRPEGLAVIDAQKKLMIPGGPLDQFAQSLGGPAEFIKGARFSSDRKMQEMVRIWDTMSTTQKANTSLHDICAKVSIEEDMAVGLATAAMYKWQQLWSNWRNAEALPEVMNHSIEVAKGRKPEGGLDDRRMQFQMGGLLPMPSGGFTINNINQQTITGVPSPEEDVLGEVIDV